MFRSRESPAASVRGDGETGVTAAGERDPPTAYAAAGTGTRLGHASRRIRQQTWPNCTGSETAS